MASVYARADSPFWWIRYKDIQGKWSAKSTKYRLDNPLETKLARAESAQLTSNELGDVGIQNREKWDCWVESFLATGCASQATLNGYRQSWQWLRSYLAEKRIIVPEQLTYQDVFDFVAWRANTGVNRQIKKSTALRDLKVLRLIMRHAVRAGFAAGNPCDGLGIRRPEPKRKRELTDSDIVAIYAALERERPWMKLAFAICLHTGCRISEAHLDAISIDFARETITFLAPKGGASRAFTTVLAPALAGIIRELTQTHPRENLRPPNPKTASQQFSKFFARNKIWNTSIHCTRVTFISRLARTAVPERVARLAVNHSSEAVHRTYQRLGIEDAQQLKGAISFPSMPSQLTIFRHAE